MHLRRGIPGLQDKGAPVGVAGATSENSPSDDPFSPPYASQIHAQRVACTPFRTVSARRWVNSPTSDAPGVVGWHHTCKG
jgi:hypothetical protein